MTHVIIKNNETQDGKSRVNNFFHFVQHIFHSLFNFHISSHISILKALCNSRAFLKYTNYLSIKFNLYYTYKLNVSLKQVTRLKKCEWLVTRCTHGTPNRIR